MRIEHSPQGHAIIHVDDQAVQWDSEEWMHLVEGLVKSDHPGLIFDCSQVKVPSSPFMSALLWSRQLCQEPGGDACIVACSERLQRALRLTDLCDLLGFADDIPSACMQLQQEPPASASAPPA